MQHTTVGIDLGTTNSLCAVFTNGEPVLIPNAHGKFLTPSVVGVLESGEVVVGATAREYRVTHPERCVSCFKRLMGSGRTVELADRSFAAHELSSLILKSLKHDAEAHLGHPIHDAVITVPAYFNDLQRQATKVAGELAGFNVRRMINEPTAAALVYGFHDRDAEKLICIVDLGGGTFDVTLMEVFEGTLEIRSTAGVSMLGGEDFTDRLVSTILRQEGLQLEVAELKMPLRVARIRSECETAKRTLAKESHAYVRVPDAEGTFTESTKRFKVTDEQFKQLGKPLMKRIAVPVAKALRDGQVEPSDIDNVILVGGATRMPNFREFTAEYFEQEPIMDVDPDQVVALGAAIQAALIQQDAAVDDMVMTDVCPFTLGVEIAKDIGGRISAGYFQPIIHRNSTIPVSREEIFSTVSANQDTVNVRVFQGDSRKVDDNLELGSLLVSGLPPSPQGLPIHVRFTYDINGLLEVEAYTPEHPEKFSVVLTNLVSGLSQDEIESAVQRMQQLKFYPREDDCNLRLARFCERILGELSPNDRQQLDHALDIYEDALAQSDREKFDRAKQLLLTTIEDLGIKYDGTEFE